MGRRTGGARHEGSGYEKWKVERLGGEHLWEFASWDLAFPDPFFFEHSGAWCNSTFPVLG